MAVVSVDERGRLTIPKEMGLRGHRVVIIPAGSFFVTIPLPENPLEAAGSWLGPDDGEDLKNIGEEHARVDAVKRAKRRKQA